MRKPLRNIGASVRARLLNLATRAFAEDPIKQRQWAAFVEDVAVKPGSLAGAVEDLADFLMPRATEALALAKQERTGR